MSCKHGLMMRSFMCCTCAKALQGSADGKFCESPEALHICGRECTIARFWRIDDQPARKMDTHTTMALHPLNQMSLSS